MRIVIASNITNGIGLERDFALLQEWLLARGHEVDGQRYDQPPALAGYYDLGIFIETISEHLLPMAKRWWYWANPEWLKPEFVKPIQRYCEKVLAKTRTAERELRAHFSGVHYVGFLTADKRDKSIKREPEFLHIGGNSGMRATNEVIAAWREYRYWDDCKLPHLTVVSNSRETAVFEDTPGVTFIKRATDEQITQLQNSCLYHLYPSAYEGWGHALHEAQSVGAILMTTHAQPMTEFHAPFEVQPYRERKVNMATLHDVNAQAIREMVPKMLELPNYEVARMQVEVRLRFEQENDAFGERMDLLLDAQEPPAMFGGHSSCDVRTVHGAPSTGSARPLRIAMLGNFHPPHSTENDLLWTLRDMGHTVVTFQENEDTTEEILDGSSGCDLWLYVHTHGWHTPGRMTLDELISALRSAGTITASFHLDKYWGLNLNDRRQDRIGQHAFWHTDHVFTADGGNDRQFSERGVIHHWLPPGVVRRDCVYGAFRKDFAIDVGFVGAENYHPEYPFRGKLIEFLRGVYGDRFRTFQGFRGKELVVLYASICVVVGDSCFGGSDRYWSDRIPETLGRGGFLIHPACPGLSIPGLVTFEPGNLYELQDRIDYYLQHAEEREHLRGAAQRWVAANETYHNRMTSLLRTVGLQ